MYFSESKKLRMSKNKLQDLVQEEYRTLPTFLFSQDGTGNLPQFSASVSFCGITFYSRGRFRTLKEAENAAANVALEALLGSPNEKPMQTDGPAVPIQIQSGEIHSNLHEANKEEMLQPPRSIRSTSEADITNMLPTSGQKEQTTSIPQICSHSNPSLTVPFASPRELSASDNSGRRTNKQNMGNICSTSGNSERERLNEQGNNVATGILGKRQRSADLQIEETISTPCFRPGDHKSQLNEFAMTYGSHLPVYSTIRVGPPHKPRFKATVNFDSQTFESPGLSGEVRQAEQAAALVALNSFSERVSTLGETPIGKILLEVKAHQEGSSFPVYSTTISKVLYGFSYRSTVKFNGMEYEGKAAINKYKAENSAAAVAWSALKERPAVSTLQVPGDKGKAPFRESSDHPLIEAINRLKDETARAGSNVLAHNNLPRAQRLAFQDQIKKVTVEVECLRELVSTISYGSWTIKEIRQDTDQSQDQQEKTVQNVIVDNDSRRSIPDVSNLPTNGWASCGNRSQHPTGPQTNPNSDHSLARPCSNRTGVDPQNTDQATAQQGKNGQNMADNISKWGTPDVGDIPRNGWGGTITNIDNRSQHPTGSQANPNTNNSSAWPCTNRSRGRQQFRGRGRGRSGGRFGGRSNWDSSPTTNKKQARAFQQAVCYNQSGVEQEKNAQNRVQNGGSGWGVTGIDHSAATQWDGWDNRENIHQPQVGSQIQSDGWGNHEDTLLDGWGNSEETYQLQHGWGNPEDTYQPQYGVGSSRDHSRSRSHFPSRGRSLASRRRTDWISHARNDKRFPSLELAVSPVRVNVQEENVQTEEVDDGEDWILPDSSDPRATVLGGWNSFDDRDPPPTTGIVAPSA